MASPDSIRRFYGRWAEPYDLLASAAVIRGWRRRLVEALDLAAGETVVELGCGTGANLPLLRERVGADGRVVGIDLTRGMLDRARTRVERAGWKNVDLVVGDATTPPLAAGVDAVVASFVVGLFEQPSSVVERWLASLNDGGRLALLDAAPSDRLVAFPLTLAFRAFTRLTAPGSRTDASSPAARLDRRVRAAHERIGDRCTDVAQTTFALGFVRLTAGTPT